MQFFITVALLVTGISAQVSSACKNSVTNEAWVGDGFCDFDGEYNTQECDFDGGDCCQSTCKSSKEFDCGARGTRQWAACKFDGATCTIRPLTGVENDNDLHGGVLIKGRGYVRASDFPCTIDDTTTFSECADCDFPYQVGKGNSWLNLVTWPQPLEKGGEEYQWIPYHSCLARGCVSYYWRTDFSAGGATVKCTKGAAPCACDDQCPRFKDCCYDYQWVCGASNKFKTDTVSGYASGGNTQYPGGELKKDGQNMGEVSTFWNTYPPKYNSACVLG